MVAIDAWGPFCKLHYICKVLLHNLFHQKSCSFLPDTLTTTFLPQSVYMNLFLFRLKPRCDAFLVNFVMNNPIMRSLILPPLLHSSLQSAMRFQSIYSSFYHSFNKHQLRAYYVTRSTLQDKLSLSILLQMVS